MPTLQKVIQMSLKKNFLKCSGKEYNAFYSLIFNLYPLGEFMNPKKALLLSAAFTGMTLGVALAHTEKKEVKEEHKVAKGECHGVNSCKGTTACGSKDHSCHGKNSCKGKGWLELTKEECEKQKGEFKEHG